MVRDIALVIGNGFSISFNNHHSISDFNDTQNPLSWPIPAPNKKGDFIDYLPFLNKFISENEADNDFSLFELAANIPPNFDRDVLYSSNGRMVTLECRHFLCIAFSHYSIFAKKAMRSSWPWYQWISKHKGRIAAVSSYNYDLILECVMSRVGMLYKDASLPDQYGPVVFHKPHGSCNYEASENFIKIDNLDYPLQQYIDNNQTRFRRLNSGSLLQPRVEPMCVIPNEYNVYAHYHLMNAQDQLYHQRLSDIKTCIFIGNSYMECDRTEIDKVLASLKQECKVIVANPSPCNLFLEKISSYGFDCEQWNSYDGPVDSSGKLISI